MLVLSECLQALDTFKNQSKGPGGSEMKRTDLRVRSLRYSVKLPLAMSPPKPHECMIQFPL